MQSISGNTRHIHLDFHTPPEVEVGKQFDAKNFFDTVTQAEINSMAIFAHCHHGFTYFDSRIGTRHPGLSFDLFGEIAAAGKQRQVTILAYFSLNVNELLAAQHPEYRALDQEGTPVDSQILLDGTELYWSWLCPNRGDYVECFFLPLVKECLQKYDVAGIFVDMAGYLPGSCFCPECRRKMKEQHLDVNNSADHIHFNSQTLQALTRRLREVLDSIRPGLRLQIGSYNAYGEVEKGRGVISEIYLESLAFQTGWQYFPFAVRYFRNFGLPTLGMTGRFLKNWGDFGTMCSLPQMKYQLGCHLLAGVESAVGDHLSCNGQLEQAVYNMIGDAFRFIAPRQTYCVGMEPMRELALLMPTGVEANAATLSRNSLAKLVMDSAKGAAKLACELHYQYDIYTHEQNYDHSSGVIVFDDTFSTAAIQKMADFVANGGLLIVHGAAALKPDPAWRRLIGVTEAQAGEADGEFYRTSLDGIPLMAHYLHKGALDVEFSPEMEILATRERSPFPRSRAHHYGHFHGPALKSAGDAIGVKSYGKGTILVLGIQLFSNYLEFGYWVHRELVRLLLERYLPKRLLKTNAPSLVEFSLGTTKAGQILLQALPFVADRRDFHSFESLNECIALHDLWVELPWMKVTRVYDPIHNRSCELQGQRIKLPPLAEHALFIVE